MKAIALSFMCLGIFSVIAGMVWGVQMSATGDHTMGPAHAHLNLIGWVSSAVFALFYHTVPDAAEGMLPKIHFGLAALAAILMPVGITMAISENSDGVARIASLLALLTMLVFLAVVFRSRRT